MHKHKDQCRKLTIKHWRSTN